MRLFGYVSPEEHLAIVIHHQNAAFEEKKAADALRQEVAHCQDLIETSNKTISSLRHEVSRLQGELSRNYDFRNSIATALKSVRGS